MLCSKSSSQPTGTATCRQQLEIRYPLTTRTAGSGTGRMGPRESRWRRRQSTLRRWDCHRPHGYLCWTGRLKEPMRLHHTYTRRAPR